MSALEKAYATVANIREQLRDLGLNYETMMLIDLYALAKVRAEREENAAIQKAKDAA